MNELLTYLYITHHVCTIAHPPGHSHGHVGGPADQLEERGKASAWLIDWLAWFGEVSWMWAAAELLLHLRWP